MTVVKAAVLAPEAPVASTSAPPDEDIQKMYKRLQNGSDVRGIAVDGEHTVYGAVQTDPGPGW